MHQIVHLYPRPNTLFLGCEAIAGGEEDVYQDLESQAELELDHRKIEAFDQEKLIVLLDEFNGEIAKKLKVFPQEIEKLTGTPKDNLIFVIASTESLSEIIEETGKLPWLPTVEVEIEDFIPKGVREKVEIH